jgi:histidine ammonia-lyase
MSTVTITEEPLALEGLLAVVDGAQVELAGGARAGIAARRAVVDRALARNDAVYGLTTKIGRGKDTRLTEDEIRGEQMFLVKSHSGGIGPLLRSPAAVFPELKQLAAPATLDTPPLDLGVEDRHTAAPLSVRKTDVALGALEDPLAIELLLARDLLAITPTEPVLGTGTDAALRMVEDAISVADPQPDVVHRALRNRFPVRLVGGSAASGRSAAR